MDTVQLSQNQDHTAFLFIDSPCLNSSMARTKEMPKKGEKGGTKVLQTRVVVMLRNNWRDPHHLCTHISSTRNLSGSRRNYEMYSRDKAARGGGEVATVVTDPTVGPHGCRGGPSMLARKEAARKNLQPTMGGKAPQKEFLKAVKVKKTQKY